MKEHDCFEHLTINDDSEGSGYYDYLICEVCDETYQDHRYICWVIPYPHLSDKIIEKIIDYLGGDDCFVDDEYGEVEVSNDIILTYPEFYKEENDIVFNRYETSDKRQWADCTSKGSYFYEFSDQETFDILIDKVSKLKRYCHGWCQFNL